MSVKIFMYIYEKDICVYEKVSGKQLYWSLFLIKCRAGGLQPYLKRDFDAYVFPANVEEFSQ